MDPAIVPPNSAGLRFYRVGVTTEKITSSEVHTVEPSTGYRRWSSCKPEIAKRLGGISRQCFGDDDGLALARLLEIPHRTLLNYMGGCTIPAEIILAIIVITGANPAWLMTGTGKMFAEVGPSCPGRPEVDGAACRLPARTEGSAL